MLTALALYLGVGIVLALDAGGALRENFSTRRWWEDAAGFVAVTVAWGPVVIVVTIKHYRSRP